MNIILFDDPVIRTDLLPFTYTRPSAKIRVGILTIAEKWETRLKARVSFLTETYLQEKFLLQSSHDNLLINGAVCPDEKLIEAIEQLEQGQALVQNDLVIAARRQNPKLPDRETSARIDFPGEITIIDKVWKIFLQNAAQLRIDFKLITEGRKSAPVKDKHTAIYGEENLFVEEGVYIRAAVINAEQGPVYLGKNSVIQEGALIRGSFALCEGGHINMGAKIRGDTTIGPFSKVGGEVSTTVIFGYTNKSHDGFLGCSVIGEWCNLGADSNTSNLKNNYDTIKIWSHSSESFVDTGLQFCGLMMGDHSKCAINTMFNTATLVDVSSNIFGEGFPKNYIPSFAWGGSGGFTTYQIDKALDTAVRVMARRKVEMDDIERDILKHIFQSTSAKRNWERNKN